MPFLEQSEIQVKQKGNLITVSTPFWSVIHDVSMGGAPVEIFFSHGLKGNCLRLPIAAEVDGLADTLSPDCEIETRDVPEGREIVFRGSLGDRQRKASAIRFETSYLYTPYRIVRRVRLTFSDGVGIARLSPLVTRLDERFDYCAPHIMKMDVASPIGKSEALVGSFVRFEINRVPEKRGVFLEHARPSTFVGLLRLGGEGIQILPSGDFSAWNNPVGQSEQGRVSLSREVDGIQVNYDVLDEIDPESPPGELTFTAQIVLSNLPEIRDVPLRTVMVGNPPFPSDDLLKNWADSGVELIAIMEGAAWFASPAQGTDRFWPINTYLGYRDAADMEDFDRLIRSVHNLGMKIITYFTPTELHPESEAFAANIKDWQAMDRPNGQVKYHYAGKMPEGIYGAWVCPVSDGWRKYLLDNVKLFLTKHEFDGVYVDLIGPWECHNSRHGPPYHSNLDGELDALESVRGLLGPDGLMVIHNGDQSFMAMANNIADMIVTFESQSWYGSFRNDLDRITCVAPAFPVCRIAMVPVSTWYRVPPLLPKQTGLRDGIAKAVLVGTVPYSYAMWEHRWGYKDPGEAIDDPNGLYAAFRKLKSLNLEGMRFDGHWTNTVSTDRAGVLGARYHDDKRQIILLSNITDEEVKNIQWECQGKNGRIDRLGPYEYRFIESGRSL